MNSNWLLLTACALAGQAAFWFPAYFSWLVFIFLVPLLYALFSGSLTFMQGCYWGAVYYALHWYGVYVLVAQQVQGACAAFIILGLLLYASMQAGAWMRLCQYCIAQCVGLMHKAFIGCMVLSAYWLWIEQFMLWFMGFVQGDCFGSLLLPLAYYPQWLRWLPFFGSTVLIVCLVAGATCCVLSFANRWYWFVGVVIFWAPFWLGWVLPRAVAPVPAYVATLGYVAPPTHIKNSLDRAQKIQELLVAYKEQHEQVEVILMPESTLPCCLNMMPAVVELLQDAGALECAVIVGAHRKEGGNLYNSFFIVSDVCIKNHYDKKMRMPFGEYLPACWGWCAHAQRLFIRNTQPFLSGKKASRPLFVTRSLSVQPVICCELFFGVVENCQRYDVPLVCLINDSWFSTAVWRERLLLCARLRALQWGRELVYVGHYGAVWIGKDGTMRPIL